MSTFTSIPFHPAGTLRQKFQRAHAAAPTDTDGEPSSQAPADALTLEDLLLQITLVSGALYVDSSMVWLAYRLAQNEPGLDDEALRALTLIVLALFTAIQEGSSRVPLGEGADDYLRVMLERFEMALRDTAAPPDDAATPQPRPPENARELIAAADEIARILQQNPAKYLHETRLKTLLAHVDMTRFSVLKVSDEDNLRLPRPKDRDKFAKPDTDAETVATIIPYHPLLLLEDGPARALTTERMLRREARLAKVFHNLTHRPTAPVDFDAAWQAIEALPIVYHNNQKQALNDEQRTAVQNAAERPLALITGGPGTGKTTIVVAVLRALVRMGYKPEEIALAAPTGKAAFRMRESATEQLDLLEKAYGGANPAIALDLALRSDLPEARTLHRLLEYSPKYNTFRRNQANRLRARVVVCDEASMIDLGMMHAIINALPDDAKLVLVGDADQLPPIGGGAPFRDLITLAPPEHPDSLGTLAAEGPAPTARFDAQPPAIARCAARLKTSYRMRADNPNGRQILELAQAVLVHQDAPDTAPNAPLIQRVIQLDDAPDALPQLGGVALLDAETALKNVAAAWYQRFYQHFGAPQKGDAGEGTSFPTTFEASDGDFSSETRATLKAIFDHQAQARILCLTQVHKTGARAINRQLHKLFAIEQDPAYKDKTPPDFLDLEPVMVIQNNYDLELFNGDTGFVANVNGRQCVLFPRAGGNFRYLPLSDVRPILELAYATSVHKAQGSEFKHVLLVLPPRDMALLTRELLYTGITRASESVTLYDPAALFSVGASRPLLRHTGLAALLVNAGD